MAELLLGSELLRVASRLHPGVCKGTTPEVQLHQYHTEELSAHLIVTTRSAALGPHSRGHPGSTVLVNPPLRVICRVALLPTAIQYICLRSTGSVPLPQEYFTTSASVLFQYLRSNQTEIGLKHSGLKYFCSQFPALGTLTECGACC